MTRHSISTILGSLLIGLVVADNTHAVRADGECLANAQLICEARGAVVSVASDYHFIEMNTTMLPCTSDRVSDTYGQLIEDYVTGQPSRIGTDLYAPIPSPPSGIAVAPSSVGGSDAPPAVCLTGPSPCMVSFG
jgi:hypothetical protein